MGSSIEAARISIIVPIFNSMEDLEACLNSIMAAMNRYGNAELILVDNGSSDGSYELLKEKFPYRAKIFQLKDVTVSALRNFGSRVADGQYLSFIDSDFLVPETYFTSAMALFSRVNAAVVLSKLHLPASPHWIEETWHYLHLRPREGYVPLYGGIFIIKGDAFHKVGGFNENLTTDEDRDLGRRLEAAGFRTYESTDHSSVHLGSPKSISAFFRRHLWHGLGQFGTLEGFPASKPLLTTLTHLILVLVAAINLFLTPASLTIRLVAFVLLPILVPIAAVGYRYARKRAVYRPFRCLILYFMYFSARLCALFALLWFKVRGQRHPQALSPRK